MDARITEKRDDMVVGHELGLAGQDRVVGRDDELASVHAFLRGNADPRVLLIRGDAGVGKSTIWDAGVSEANTVGLRVLMARAAESEAGIPFAVLSDLLRDVDLETVPDLPEPQRRAIAVALLREDASGSPPEPHGIALGVAHVIRSLATNGSVLIAIDDVQWADVASSEALAYAVRRLETSGVKLLLARRPGAAPPIEASVRSFGIRTVTVAGLSVGAIRRLLADRLGLALARRVALQLTEMTLGNPLYALEMGRVLAVDGPPAAGEDLRVPESLEALVGSRLQASPAGAEALLAVALGGPLRVDQLLAVTSASEIDAAVLGGLLVDDGTRYVSSHPLLATMVARQASRLRRLAVHRGLARAATDPVRVAGHLAEAASRPDSAVAATVATGAQLAFDRGASAEAVKLAREALRLTPPADPERSDRVLRLGNYLQRATEMTALAALLDRELDQLPPGSPRALGHLLAAHIARSQEEYLHHLEAAGAAASDPFTRTIVLAEMVLERAMAWLDVGPGVQARADEILVLAAAAGRGLTEARYSAAWVRLLSGRPVEDLAPPAGERPGPADPSEYGYERVRGLRLAFRGCVDEARIVLAGEVASAIERGDEDAWGTAHHLLCELELRAGRTGVAEAMVDEDTSELDPLRVGMHSHAARLRAVAAAIRGDPAAARTWAGRARGLVVGQHWDVVEIERALGIAALFEGRAPTSLEHLLLVWNDTIGGSVREVGAFPVAADLVEASLASGNRELASSVVQRLSTLAAEQDHPWGLATLRRCTAMVALHDGTPVETARADLLAAADRYTALGCHFDAARTLLTLGRHARRAKRWATARDALKDALSIFDDLGCTGWAALTRELMAGVGGRRPSATSELTPSERRTVALAAVGRSNKDIAAELFVSVHTVEVHLGHAFRKLDVTSRAQLAGALERGTERESPPII